MGWDVQVERDESAHEQFVGKVAREAADMAVKLGIIDAVATKLIEGGLNSIDLLAEVEPADVAEAAQISEAEGAAIIAKAKEINEREAAPAQG
jgi:hypothetical protein